MSEIRYSRRAFVQLSASVTATLLIACRDTTGSTGAADSGLDAPDVPVTVNKPPWVTLLGPGAARLRLESRDAQAVTVFITIADTSPMAHTPVLSETELTYSWADVDGLDVLADQEGLHVLQDVLLEGLPEDAVVSWRVNAGDGVIHEGRFRTSPGNDATITLGWIADTMHPFSAGPIATMAATMAAVGIDLIIHGGDIQYQSSPVDTWNGFFDAIAPLAAQAPLHLLVGNHEFESQDEIAVMYERLAAPQGDGASPRYFAFRYGSILFICLDTETGDLSDPTSPQRTWLSQTLSQDDDHRYTIVCMHRPSFTFSKHWRSDPTLRDALHAEFLTHGVDLVLAGHAHCYERFMVDGLPYVVDGGGGALTYDPDEGMTELEAVRPDEISLRQVADRSYGVTFVQASPDGLTVWRIDEDGVETDRFNAD
ncbi:MAG: metallophosphoesterase [Myxococcota bacterium]